jgi:TolB protein
MNKVFLFLLSLCVCTTNSLAVLKIDITKGSMEPIPIAIDGFEGGSAAGRQIMEVINNDLESCGLFRIIDNNAYLEKLSIDKVPTHSHWRKINANAVLIGDVERSSKGELTVKFRIWDSYSEKQLHSMVYTAHHSAWRRLAHKVADAVYTRLTGENPFFDSRIVYITESGSMLKRVKRLAIMDSDGANDLVLTSSKYLTLTPRFDPKSQRIIFMSFRNKIPQVFLLDLASGKQELLGSFPGMSFAPRFSPDGNYAIMSLAKDGTTDIIELDLNNRVKKKLTSGRGIINTSPSYSPDGKYIVFNSDRGGSLQLYIMDRAGSNIKRISFGQGSYATPVWSPRGDLIAFTKISHGRFHIGVMRPDGSGERILTSAWLAESPSWSPNGRVIAFAKKEKGGHSQLYAIDITGYHERILPTETAASDPAWSPLLD